MIAATALLLLAAPERLEAAPLPPPRLVVERGRATVVREGRLDVRTPGSSETAIDGPGHLEVAADSVARLAWDGRASILVTGPAAFAWPDDARVELQIEALAGASVEVRRDVARLSFPGGWELEVAGGLVWIAEAPGRVFDIRRDAGSPLRIAAPDEPGWPRPPIRVGSGARVRLGPRRVFEIVTGGSRVVLDPRALTSPGRHGAPEALSGDARAELERFDWPWNRPEEEPDDPEEPVDAEAASGAGLDSEPAQDATSVLASSPSPGRVLPGPPAPAPEPLGPPVPRPSVSDRFSPEPAQGRSAERPAAPRDPSARWRSWRRSVGEAVRTGSDGFAAWGRDAAANVSATALRWVRTARQQASERERLRRQRAAAERPAPEPAVPAVPEAVVPGDQPEYSSEPRPGYVREVGPWGLRWRRVRD